MNARHAAVAAALAELEAEMRSLALWEAVAPAAEAFESTVPFCHDTMEFHQWLQWVFVARLRALLDAGAPLPSGSAVAPLAELTWENSGRRDIVHLIALLARIDGLLNGR